MLFENIANKGTLIFVHIFIDKITSIHLEM